MNATDLMSHAEKTYHQMIPGLQHWLQPNAPGKHLPQLRDVLRLLPGAPERKLLLGVCKDGAPFLLDLLEPDSGSLLIAGETGSGKTRHLQTVVESGLLRFAPHEIQLGVITAHPREWLHTFSGGARRRHCIGLHHWSEPGAAEMVRIVADMAESRLQSRQPHTQILLVVDDLSQVSHFDLTAQSALYRLVENGPRSGIWPICSVNSEEAARLPYWMAAFRTRLLGKMPGKQFAPFMIGSEMQPFPQMQSGEFSVRLGCDWLTYDLPAGV